MSHCAQLAGHSKAAAHCAAEWKFSKICMQSMKRMTTNFIFLWSQVGQVHGAPGKYVTFKL